MNYRVAIRQELDNNTTNKVVSTVAARRNTNGRSRAQAKKRVIRTSTISHSAGTSGAWYEAVDTDASYDELENSFWS